MKKELKIILKEYGIRQDELYDRFGWYFEDVTRDLLDDLIRQLDISEGELERIMFNAYGEKYMKKVRKEQEEKVLKQLEKEHEKLLRELDIIQSALKRNEYAIKVQKEILK